MIKIITGVFVGMMALGAVAFASPLEIVTDSTYRLYDGNRFNCSAVAISDTSLLTAAHCVTRIGENFSVGKENQVDGKTHSKISFSVTVDSFHKNADLARLSIKDTTAKLSFTDMATQATLEMGTPVYAVGYPRGHELTLTEGMITTKTLLPPEMGLKGTFYKTTVPITGGFSGGGLYIKDGEDYFLIGLATAAFRDVSFQSYFSTLENLKKITKVEFTEENE